MLSTDTIASFFLAAVLLALAPGPDNIFVLTQSAVKGKLAGILVTLGLSTGLIVHTTAVALGVAIIFKTSAVAFTILKMAGVGYLLYLAWAAFRAGSSDINLESDQPARLGKLYIRGIILNVTNPKVSIFFLAFLPQFADPALGSVTIQIFHLGGLFILSTLLVFGGIALVAGTLGDFLNQSSKAQIIMNRIAGSVFVGLALKLVTTERI